jgi:hypothetical protein
LLLFELADPMNAVSSGDAPPAWTESNILDVDDCNDDVDFLAAAVLSRADDDPCSGDDDDDGDASPPRMPHKCRDSRNEFCSECCRSGGIVVAPAATVNTDAAVRMTKVDEERIALEYIALQLCVVFCVCV